jgi:hypothetical protein
MRWWRRSRATKPLTFERRADDEPFPEHLGYGLAAFEPKPELDAPALPASGRPFHEEKQAFTSRPSFGNRSPFGDRLGWSPEDPRGPTG